MTTMPRLTAIRLDESALFNQGGATPTHRTAKETWTWITPHNTAVLWKNRLACLAVREGWSGTTVNKSFAFIRGSGIFGILALKYSLGGGIRPTTLDKASEINDLVIFFLWHFHVLFEENLICLGISLNRLIEHFIYVARHYQFLKGVSIHLPTEMSRNCTGQELLMGYWSRLLKRHQ